MTRGIHFINDIDKMRDFFILTKQEFLDSYSYLNEEDYDATSEKVQENNLECDVCHNLTEDYETTEDQQVFCIDCMEEHND